MSVAIPTRVFGRRCCMISIVVCTRRRDASVDQTPYDGLRKWARPPAIIIASQHATQHRCTHHAARSLLPRTSYDLSTYDLSTYDLSLRFARILFAHVLYVPQTMSTATASALSLSRREHGAGEANSLQPGENIQPTTPAAIAMFTPTVAISSPAYASIVARKSTVPAQTPFGG
jgi:hypothetical protein